MQNRGNKQKANNKIVNQNPNISIITLNSNGQNIITKDTDFQDR